MLSFISFLNFFQGKEEQPVIKTETHEVFSEDKNFAKGEKVGEFRLGSTIVLVSVQWKLFF